MSDPKREKNSKGKKKNSPLEAPADEAIEQRVELQNSDEEPVPEPPGEDLDENLER